MNKNCLQKQTEQKVTLVLVKPALVCCGSENDIAGE